MDEAPENFLRITESTYRVHAYGEIYSPISLRRFF
jgi:hypothetical protein